MTTTDSNYINPNSFNLNSNLESPERLNQPQTTSKNNMTLKELMAGKTAHQFAEEFVHSIHIQRLAENQKLSPQKFETNKVSNPLYKSASFTNYHPDPDNPDEKPSGPSVFTYLSNSIRIELEKKGKQKNRGIQVEGGAIGKLCKIMLSPENSRRIEEKANVMSYKADQEFMCERLNNERKEKLQKREEDKRRILQQEMVECSFAPKINEASKLKGFRSPEEYYLNQLKWEEKIKDNIKNKKLEKEKNENKSNPKPQISKKTKDFAQNSIDKKKLPKDVHQRLYEIKKDQQILEAKNKLNKENPDFMVNYEANPHDDSGFFTTRNNQDPLELTFSPKITLKSKLLVQQKKDRLSKTNEPPEKAHCTCPGCTQKPSNPKNSCFKLSNKSEIAFIQRFIREYQEKIKETLHQDQAIKLHFIELEQILKNMGFLRVELDKKEIIGKETLKNSNTKLLKEVWSLLLGKQRTWVTSRNLLVFLLAVMNLKGTKELVPLIEDAELMKEEKECFGEEIEDLSNVKNYGRFSFYGNLELSENDVKNIHKDYKALYLNKIAKNKEQEEILEKHIYSPEVNKYSKELAESQKKKLFDEFKGTIPNTLGCGSEMDYYQISNFRIAQKEKELEALRNSSLNEQMNKCTFTPSVSDFKQAEKKLRLSNSFQSKDYTKLHHGTPTTSLGKDRFLELYSLKKLQSDKKDKDFNEWDYEKQCEECTFKPDIEKSKLNNDIFNPKMVFSKGIEKNIERLQKGRIEKNLVESLKKKGLTPNESRTNKLLEEVRKNEEGKSIKISGIYRNSSKTISQNNSHFSSSHQNEYENIHNDSEVSQSNKHYSTIIPEDGVPTFGLRNDDDDRLPLLFVDVNITEGRNARIVIYEGDQPEDLAEKFAEQYNLELHMTEKLKELLELQINNLLHKIEEEEVFSESMSQRD